MPTHVEDVGKPHSAQVVEDKDEEQQVTVDAKDALDGALRATDEEHRMTLMEGLRKYPSAAWWSAWFSMTLVMQGFDHAFIFGFIAFPAFEQKYGRLNPSGQYEIPAELQAGITNGVAAGEIVGLVLNAYATEYFGNRKVMIVSLVALMGFVFLQFFAQDIYMYLGAEILLGIPWGVFQTLTTTYAAEICPGVLRPYLTMFVPGCWSIGYLIGTGVIRGFVNVTGEWAYRIPFALQWIPPIPIIIAVYFAPESPWWLVRKGRIQEATKMVRRLRAKDATEDDISDTIAMMQHTTETEQQVEKRSFWELFKGVNLRRTEIAFWVYTTQQLCAMLLSYIVYFLQQAGLPTSTSFEFAMGQYAMGTVGTVVAWFLVPRWGRRTFLLTGISFMSATTLVIGFIGLGDTNHHPALANAVGSILMIQYFVFFATLAPITYTIVTEIPSTYLRTKTVALGRVGYNAVTFVYGQLLPRMIQKTSWNWGARCGLFFGGIMALCFVWAFFRVPETKGRTFAEINILFHNKVKARKFSKTQVNIASGSVI
ncbi:unnamed protein product [Clonostachys byssicola]|uniref:Major facilitator superfamily (MFS) profile domain-containing protein n=1 Tax=Clonostachys byssicola TaxID=160290 RepID=A0A9N9Y4Q0_9HYPO|nr:unnamed protein product [Clonostachys byssicola]